jgi:nucleoside-diphosphate-sugar epimerase
MAFRVLIIGGTGQVGAAVVRALVAEPSCAEVVMVNRKAIPLNTIALTVRSRSLLLVAQE